MYKINALVKEERTAPFATLTLPFEKRQICRQRVLLDNGDEASLMIERGIVLRGGDHLQLEDGRQVEVRAAEETVSTVYSDDPLLLARACYHLGNRHVSLEIRDGWIRYQHDHVLDDMVRELGLAVVCERAPFEPEAGAYAQGHSHSHGHNHSHGHGHEH